VVENDPAMVATFASLLSPAYMGVGRIEDACNMADIGLASLRGVRADHVGFYLEVAQTTATLALGRLKEAGFHAERAQTLADRAFGTHSFGEGIVNVLKGIVHYENNELEAAERLLNGSLRREVLINGWFELYAAGFSAAAEMAAVHRDSSAVDAILAQADTIATQRRLPRLSLLVALLRMSAATTAGNLPYAMNLMHGPAINELLTAAPESISAWSMKLRTHALLESARLLNRLGRARDAAIRLTSVDRRYVQAADARLRFTYQTLAMEITFQLRRNEEAATYFSEALNLALESGFVRRLLNCREQILAVFDWMMSSGRPVSSRIVDFCSTALRNAANDESRLDIHKRLLAPRRRDVPPAGSNLTPREMEILSLIAEGLSTKEIAHRISITTSTVKTHRRNVFEKLGVKRRSQAIARARERLLI
jgi:LuxR family maltose regulon positive regulatory protein